VNERETSFIRLKGWGGHERKQQKKIKTRKQIFINENFLVEESERIY